MKESKEGYFQSAVKKKTKTLKLKRQNVKLLRRRVEYVLERADWVDFVCLEDVGASQLVEFLCWDIVRVVKEVPQRKRKTSPNSSSGSLLGVGRRQQPLPVVGRGCYAHLVFLLLLLLLLPSSSMKASFYCTPFSLSSCPSSSSSSPSSSSSSSSFSNGCGFFQGVFEKEKRKTKKFKFI